MAMLFTHILSGILISILFPGYAYLILVGSILPDLDIIIGTHRKTLHDPSIYISITIFLLVFDFIFNIIIFKFILIIIFMSFIHCLLDYFAAGDELKPWDKNNPKSKSLYLHYKKDWIISKRYYYDGSLGDISISIVCFSLIYLFHTNDKFIFISSLSLIFGLIYFYFRKRITDYFDEDMKFSDIFNYQ